MLLDILPACSFINYPKQDIHFLEAEPFRFFQKEGKDNARSIQRPKYLLQLARFKL